MRRIILYVIFCCFIVHSGFSQVKGNQWTGIIFKGLVLDASTFSPITNTQIMINKSFSSATGNDGTFAFYVNRNDTVVFKSLGYKPETMVISDTLSGREFIAGVYMNSDTLSIGEVVIIPKFSNLKSDILNAKTTTPAIIDNARYNIAISGYQGRNSTGSLGDPSSNYISIQRKQMVDAYEKGGIPSDKILGFNALVLLPVAYMLLTGLPEKPVPMKPEITQSELDQVQKKYLELLKQRK
jgi:hypothetical protein